MSHIENRDEITSQLEREVVGPWPAGREIDVEGPIASIEPDDRGPYRQAGSGEEILTRESPTRRYGAGILYPARVADDGNDARLEDAEQVMTSEADDGARSVEAIRVADGDVDTRNEHAKAFEEDRDDFELTSANRLRPSSMGVSLLVELDADSTLTVDVSGGRYELRLVGAGRRWWLRRPVRETARFGAEALMGAAGQSGTRLDIAEPLQLDVIVRSRPYPWEGRHLRLLTVSLVNRSERADRGPLDERCLFQSRFAVRVENRDGRATIHPYPESRSAADDAESASIALLYRRARTFAVGHGCAADWAESRGGEQHERVGEVRAECLPTFDTPSITPDAVKPDGRPLAVRMAELAGLVDGVDGFGALEEVAAAYEAWIAEQREEAQALPAEHSYAAANHLEQCESAARRIRSGIAYLRTNSLAREAFALANRAMLMQWSRSRLPARDPTFDEAEQRLTFAEDCAPLDAEALRDDPHSWRAFQIAFLLMTIGSVDDGASEHRETVELIWFPTGGGKTEAYLGLAAFQMFLRRLNDPSHGAVDVLMRYTLRLLTAQQFERAATLIAAMEQLRREREVQLGTHPFAIGLWVGAGSRPNQRSVATRALRELEERRSRRNPFILLRCPWCRVGMGPFRPPGRRPRGSPPVLGYEHAGGTVQLKCPDPACEFSQGLPVHVIDDDIYTQRPSFVIATVDKFATLAWRPQARALFGLSDSGSRSHSPPGLVIQDELHLISGPLGSMVGLYEALIEELCTDRRSDPPVRPKIVSSTATISRYRDQIQALFGRSEVTLFPPPALDIADSFFGRHAMNDDGSLLPGRRYVGLHAPGFGSLAATQVRVYASMLQAPHAFDPEHRDPWWTLVVFFNSLRELGAAVSLVQSDVPDHLRVVRERVGLPWDQLRRLRRTEELTGRLQDHEVPAMLDAMSVSTTDRGRGQPIDICLASSILEVGVDIDRLSLMAVVGQPKTTAQYIQATGRVGRSWWEPPGLILSLYSPSRPRDRSHFERFRTYHQQLYAQVEPTSVTPFSRPALERALHAVMAIYARQAGDSEIADRPYPYPAELMERLRRLLRARIDAATGSDPDALSAFEEVFDRRAAEWQRWERARWDGRIDADTDVPLMRRSGAYASAEVKRLSWPTPLSLRNVDAECEGAITTLYVTAPGSEQ